MAHGDTIVGDGFLQTPLSVRWRFEPVSDTRMRLTQRLELSARTRPLTSKRSARPSSRTLNLDAANRNLMVGPWPRKTVPSKPEPIRNGRSIGCVLGASASGRYPRQRAQPVQHRRRSSGRRMRARSGGWCCAVSRRARSGPEAAAAIAKTALGAELTVRWEYQADTSAALARMRPSAITSSRSKRLAMRPTCMTGRRRALCLVFGHEREGVTHQLPPRSRRRCAFRCSAGTLNQRRDRRGRGVIRTPSASSLRRRGRRRIAREAA